MRNALDAEGNDGVGISPVPLKTRNPTPSGGFRWTLEDKDFLKKFFDDVPKTPSHYCRKDTQKLYLDVLISTKTKLYLDVLISTKTKLYLDVLISTKTKLYLDVLISTKTKLYLDVLISTKTKLYLDVLISTKTKLYLDVLISTKTKLYLDVLISTKTKLYLDVLISTKTKLYLDVLISTKTKLYEIYKLRCSVFGMSPFSITLFNNYFKENNYSLFKPHKDQCNTCIGKDTGNASEEVYNKHYELKCSALDQKECDKRDNDENTLVYCCDTDALLVSPRNNSNAMYYRTKLNIHNLTFYNLKTHDVLNYMRDEVNGQIECDNFISIHVDYITQLIENHPSVNVLIIWSDGCNYQNR